ncbi:ferrous iron transport protein B [Venenivibrio stagnispumantis]|uniref:Ferrous iron transport protein B n=1 Tax=Venenivibrio stagnispumantis TaxID=407998 RepID=A0AA45WLR0_9AQUI|nr:ferrous iron transport protein B [Venenivibrio stagnispumantis]MCW4573274.1 ferrous iron transport protein B [Venenivibrio stagnispumantis]SMP11435.1 ferrous iron transport protein B [Venenivibrio stagnispumantis]
MKEITVAFVGNPNVGKTALINSIAGTKLKVGNWPGVTVEKKEAEVTIENIKLKLIDLPGVYSLRAYTLEEKITREFLLKEKPDIIVNVVDATNLERNLYLTTQLMELGIPMVIALNMWDEFLDLGYKLDINKFEEFLGLKVVPTVAVKEVGIEDLLKAILETIEKKIIPKQPKYSERVEAYISKVINDLPFNTEFKRFIAIKVLEGDLEIIESLGDNAEKIKGLIKEFEELLGEDGESLIAEERYSYIESILRETLKHPVEKKRNITEILDAIFLNRILGIPVFLFIMYIVFKLTFDGSGPFIDWADGLKDFIGRWVGQALSLFPTPEWIQSLIIDGIVGGVGLVLTFVPLLIFLYFFLAILEESGYMARAAFVMDRIMQSFGLHGKSFIPMIIGFGCNVPAIYATRALENETDRKLTALLVPFMSCGARLPIYALFTALFFKEHRAEVTFLMYLIGIIVAILIGIILKKLVFKREPSPFILELPPYRFPTLKLIWSSIWTRTKAFTKKAGTVILATMILLWIFTKVPYGEKPENTLLGRVATTISPVFKPCGFTSWEAVAALIPGTIAKEVVISSLGVLYGVNKSEETEEKISFTEDFKNQIKGFYEACIDSLKGMFGSLKPSVFEMEDEETPLQKALKADFTPLSAFSYMVFCLLWVPCIATIGAIYQEFGWRMVGASVLLNTITPYIISSLVYNIGKLLGF